MREYYAVELEERLHDMTQPNPLPWVVYQKGISTDLWIADCQSDRIAKILVIALTEEEKRIAEMNRRKPFKERIKKRAQRD